MVFMSWRTNWRLGALGFGQVLIALAAVTTTDCTYESKDFALVSACAAGSGAATGTACTLATGGEGICVGKGCAPIPVPCLGGTYACGNGKCVYSPPDANAQCAAASCTSGMLTPASVCGENGASQVPPAQSCGGLACFDAAACMTSCAGTTDCIGGYYCGGSGPAPNQCIVQSAAGAPCSAGEQCLSNSCSVQGICSVAVKTTSLPNGMMGSSYTAALQGVGDTSYTWLIAAGGLPAGLSISAAGAISGTPKQSGIFGVLVQVQGTPSAQTATASLVIDVVAPLTIATLSLPDGMVGYGYAQPLVATGGTPPYAWSIQSGNLPVGLALDPATGKLSGTPSTAKTFSFMMKVASITDPTQMAMQSLSIIINSSDQLTVVSGQLPDGVVARPYVANLAAVGGTPPYTYTWSVQSGALPAGLALQPYGSVVGTPSTAGPARFVVQVVDSGAPQNLATAAFVIEIDAPLTITTTGLPTGVVGSAYLATLNASGGTAPYTWSLPVGTSNESLPAGLALSAGGPIAGTPTVVGDTAVTFAVTDSAAPPQTQKVTLGLLVDPPLAIMTNSLPGAMAGGQSYLAQLRATGGVLPYAWRFNSAAPAPLSPWLTLSADGGLSGAPSGSVTGCFNVPVAVTDAETPAMSQSAILPLCVSAAGTLAITTGSLSDAVAGKFYSSGSMTVAGGTEPYSWSVVGSQTLPSGLSLDSSRGIIAGSVATAGTYAFTVQVADSSYPKPTATQVLQLTVVPPIKITTTSLPAAIQNVPYAYPLVATGGTLPLVWSAGSGLPTWLEVSPSGVLVGENISANGGLASFPVCVTDSSLPAQSPVCALLSLSYFPSLAVVPNGPVGPGTVNQAFSMVGFTASGGTGSPYQLSVSTTTPLPAGLSLSSGYLMGTPTPAVVWNGDILIQVTDSGGNVALSHPLQLVVAPSLTIVTASLPVGVAGQSWYSTTLQAAGGNPAYYWTLLSGPLPSSLTLSSGGTISGAIWSTDQTTAYSFTVQVMDANSHTVWCRLNLQVSISGSLFITTTSLPNGVVGQPYSSPALTASGGSGTYTWTVPSGGLPALLSLQPGIISTEVIEGKPSAAGTFVFDLHVKDVPSNNSADRFLSITVENPLTVTTTSLPLAIEGQPYNVVLTSSGGIAPFAWISTTLPSWLLLNPSTGALTGSVPQGAAGTASDVSVQVSDGWQQSQPATLPLNVDTLMSIQAAVGTIAVVGKDLKIPLTVVGGTAPYGWKLLAGALPPDLVLDSQVTGASAAITGTLTQAGTYGAEIAVTDSLGQQATYWLMITVSDFTVH